MRDNAKNIRTFKADCGYNEAQYCFILNASLIIFELYIIYGKNQCAVTALYS